jgi:hypothetical protein
MIRLIRNLMIRLIQILMILNLSPLSLSLMILIVQLGLEPVVRHLHLCVSIEHICIRIFGV